MTRAWITLPASKSTEDSEAPAAEESVVEVTFLMNDAGFSHLNPDWLRLIPGTVMRELKAESMNDSADPSIVSEIIVDLDRTVYILFKEPQPMPNDPARFRRALSLTISLEDDPKTKGSAKNEDDHKNLEAIAALSFEEKKLLRRVIGLASDGNHQAVVDLLEALPDEKRAALLTGELARAHNNLADAPDSPHLERSIELLESIEEDLGDTHLWNFRAGYALFKLERRYEALQFFKKAEELRPGDEDSLLFIERCRTFAALPWFERPFAKRVDEVWAAFDARDAEIRSVTSPRVALGLISDILKPVMKYWGLELGRGVDADGRRELVLSPDGWRMECFPLMAFARRMPEGLKAHWKLTLGRQAVPQEELQCIADFPVAGMSVDAADITIWPEKADLGWSLRLYSDALAGFAGEDASSCFAGLAALFDAAVGEAARLRWLDAMTLLRRPLLEPGLKLWELPDFLHAHAPESEGYRLAEYAAFRADYMLKPNADPDIDLLFDIFEGDTICPQLRLSYQQMDGGVMNALAEQGAAAGFFFIEVKNPNTLAFLLPIVIY